MTTATDVARLIVSCRDRHGIVAAIANTLAEEGANIVSSAQHSTDPENGMFFLRMEFHLLDLPSVLPRLKARLRGVADEFEMNLRIERADCLKRTVVFVSRMDHCLLDILWRWRHGELAMDLAAVVSNHPDHQAAVESFGVPYYHIPVTHKTKLDAEAQVLELFGGKADLGILARYMQILTPEFLERFGAPIINIHHSFLPAFVGKDPYARAFERGVKLIGATAHYATPDLDEGPIIEQDVGRVSHADIPEDLARVGRDVERLVLARAVRWHLEDRVIVHGSRTIVFAA